MISRGDGEIPRQQRERAKDRTGFAASIKAQYRQFAQFLTGDFGMRQ
jgi:hypothetical protein